MMRFIPCKKPLRDHPSLTVLLRADEAPGDLAHRHLPCLNCAQLYLLLLNWYININIYWYLYWYIYYIIFIMSYWYYIYQLLNWYINNKYINKFKYCDLFSFSGPPFRTTPFPIVSIALPYCRSSFSPPSPYSCSTCYCWLIAWYQSALLDACSVNRCSFLIQGCRINGWLTQGFFLK